MKQERHSTPRTASGGATAETAGASLLEVHPKGLTLRVRQQKLQMPVRWKYTPRDCVWGCNSRNYRCQSAGSVPRDNLREVEEERKPNIYMQEETFFPSLSLRQITKLHKNQRHALLNLECSLRLMH